MTTYSGDVQKMTQQELENALKQIAANWRERPYLSDDYSEGLRYGELPSGTGFVTPSLTFLRCLSYATTFNCRKRFERGNMPRPAVG